MCKYMHVIRDHRVVVDTSSCRHQHINKLLNKNTIVATTRCETNCDVCCGHIDNYSLTPDNLRAVDTVINDFFVNTEGNRENSR